MEKITIVADCREDFPSTTNTKHYNDHYSRKSIQDIQMAIQKLGYLCEWMGGVKSLIQSLNGRYENTSTLYLNFNAKESSYASSSSIGIDGGCLYRFRSLFCWRSK